MEGRGQNKVRKREAKKGSVREVRKKKEKIVVKKEEEEKEEKE